MNFQIDDVTGPARAITFGGLAILLFLAAQDVATRTPDAAPEASESAEAQDASETADPAETQMAEAEATGETDMAAADAAAEPTPATEEAPAETQTAEAETTETDMAATDMAAEPAPATDDAPAETQTAEAEASGETDMAEADMAEPAPATEEAPAETQGAETEGEAAAAPEAEASGADGAGDWPAEQMAYLDGDAAAGEQVWRQCAACHVADQEQNRVGPHLVGIVGRDVASIESFRYSNALQELQGQVWTPEELDAWIENPRGYARGTSMGYGGLRDEGQRRDLLAYLASLQD
ncbi:c-type cytochrome [Roseibacterium sp. SDUM158017]|uniref:c-type cytochrome n=1 Tax=Roseicyclus salinarum TaxID=3036773 RepID=UPI0024158549|nr:c-type cytochrome [Roseibacterium sp. SDUM158017]MDG4648437.1 c-type cytochrome [Roseibacterium sp. SDUM158017]